MPGNQTVYTRPEFVDSQVPLPTTRPPPMRTPTNHASLRRGKTLTRPERSVRPPPLINPPTALPSGATLPPVISSTSDGFDTWTFFSHLVTFWAPSVLLSSLGGMRDKATRQAWREKVALCLIALLLGGAVGFATVGLDRVLCPTISQSNPTKFTRIGSTPGTLGILGNEYNASNAQSTIGVDFLKMSQSFPGQDITSYFARTSANFPACNGLSFKAATGPPCPNGNSSCPLGPLTSGTVASYKLTNTTKRIGYGWDQVANLTNFFVLDGNVLNMQPYMAAHKSPISDDPVDTAIKAVLLDGRTGSGKDGTRTFYRTRELQDAVPCLVQRYNAGNIDKITPGCFISNLMLYAGLIVILGLVMARFVMACIFSWFISAKLVQPPKNLARTVISPSVLPEGANVSLDNANGTAPWANKGVGQRKPGAKIQKNQALSPSPSSTTLVPNGNHAGVSPTISMAQIGQELFCVCLVTCYSEGEASLRTTLDSISNTNYSDNRKLLFVVADGMITGAGEKRSTPDICVSLLDADPRFGTPTPMSYIAVASGAKAHNRAMVYAGHYTVSGRRTPTVILVKCGTDSEAVKDKKPGNRGKRDGQLILMNFFSRITYNDRMTPLDFDLFRKIHTLMGVTPDYFEACLMVDADTKVYPDSLRLLVNTLHHDNLVMGVCGETRIANKRQSWVTAIQVYEYFISHHMAKAFESVFGGVTCLPGCFSMYRLKARKANDDDWIPLIVHPDIIREYSQSEVHTLHQKNLLLLGEDRFLTTVLLRTFPNRKMMFCPQAKCRTVAPDTFSVLLSQRRRWINSTIHNLMELVKVRNLCGTFCFSMQFVVFMDLLGTVVLPVAICLTYVLIVSMATHPPDTFSKAIPLLLLVAVIGLPGVLILITTFKIVYVFWMFIYLAALPIWNFVLPVYAFWHFDDFSWGQTRKVAGEGKDQGHGADGTVSAANAVPLRRWEDWERSRLKKLKREERRRRELAKNYPGGFHDNGEFLRATREEFMPSFYEGSDTTSIASSAEEDKWGAQIGAYNENHSSFPLPPQTLLAPETEVIQNAETVGMDELEAILDQGFDTRPSPTSSTADNFHPYTHRLPPNQKITRLQLAEHSRSPDGYGPVPTVYGDIPPRAPRARAISPVSANPLHGISSALGHEISHVRRRSNGETPIVTDYGPLGPLGSPPTRPRRI
ncbi:chitin synthase-domain-containing protein [Cantharellus anzutake]|uniref:chitin synthase-domain-containing protein n=1 Tax=Cantharellus anzutake TaxID=1750568 RepID=UPI001903E440|nr:chitin synthase-domain-containing protein [Cantharellus anzutake]KAF8332603.1 chitin synthase-domain-containing protein [Cantharellus anzutake]